MRILNLALSAAEIEYLKTSPRTILQRTVSMPLKNHRRDVGERLHIPHGGIISIHGLLGGGVNDAFLHDFVHWIIISGARARYNYANWCLSLRHPFSVDIHANWYLLHPATNIFDDMAEGGKKMSVSYVVFVLYFVIVSQSNHLASVRLHRPQICVITRSVSGVFHSNVGKHLPHG